MIPYFKIYSELVRMKKLFKSLDFIVIIFISIGLLYIYSDVLLNGKIIFPSNFLAQFYSPWRTEKFPSWEAGIPHKPIGDDQIRLFYPERTFTNLLLSKNILPLWNPHTFSGTPFLADLQSAIFYPPNILYFFLPQLTAWQILLLIQPIMATAFMYIFLKILDLKKPAAWLGAIAFGFCGFILAWSQEHVTSGQAILWLPLVMFGIEGYLRHRKLKYYLIAIIALACSIVGGFIQQTFYVYLFSFIYVLYRINTLRLNLSYLLKVMFIYIFSVSLTAIQLFPSIEAFLESPRSTSSAWYLFEGYLLPVTHILNALVPDIFGNPGTYNFFGRGFYRETILYIGVIPLFLATYAIFKSKKNTIIMFFIFGAILSFFLTIDSPFTRWFFRLPIPFLPTFLPSRILTITAFSLSVLSAFGLSKLIKERKNDKKIPLSIILIFYFAFFLIGIYAILLLKFGDESFFRGLNDYIIRHSFSPTRDNVFVLLKNLILPFAFFSIFVLLLIFKNKTKLFLYGVVFLTLLSQFYFLKKYSVIGEAEFLYPKNPVTSFLQSRSSFDRFLTFRESFEENISTYFGIYSAEGANPVFPRRYGELLFAIKNNGKLIKDIPRIEARLSELGDKENPFEDNRRLRLFSLLGIKYILYFDDQNPKNSGANKFSGNLFKPIWRHGNWYGLEYLNSFPRAFLASSIHIENNPQKILDLIFDPKIDLSTSVILEDKPLGIKSSGKLINLEKLSKNSLVNIKSYQPQEIIIETKTDTPRMLFISDNFYPGWQAFVNGKETKIYRTNYTFRSIYLSAGNHTIIFKYNPQSFRIGSTISIFTGFILILIILMNVRSSAARKR